MAYVHTCFKYFLSFSLAFKTQNSVSLRQHFRSDLILIYFLPREIAKMNRSRKNIGLHYDIMTAGVRSLHPNLF